MSDAERRLTSQSASEPEGLTTVAAAPHEERPKPRAAKVGHKKSRKGCLKCKARRVKCDEASPICGNCQRLGLDCSYAEHNGNVRNRAPKASSKSPSRYTPQAQSQRTLLSTDDLSAYEGLSNNNQGPGKLPESRERRLLELRLQHFWLVEVSPQLATTLAPNWRDVWNNLPHMALLHEGLLCSTLTLCATYLLLTQGPDELHTNARNQYLVLGLSELQSGAERLRPSNASAIALSAHLINLNALFMLKERGVDPYKPPLDWLHLSRIVATVHQRAALIRATNATTDDKIEMIMDANSPNRRPWAEVREHEGVRQIFEPLLNHISSSDNDWNEDTREIYQSTLSYIADIRNGTEEDASAYGIARAIYMFAMAIPAEFIRLLEEEQPRALVTLAYFFATVVCSKALVHLDVVKGLKDALKEEVNAIARSLPDEWQWLMAWPLHEIQRTTFEEQRFGVIPDT